MASCCSAPNPTITTTASRPDRRSHSGRATPLWPARTPSRLPRPADRLPVYGASSPRTSRASSLSAFRSSASACFPASGRQYGRTPADEQRGTRRKEEEGSHSGRWRAASTLTARDATTTVCSSLGESGRQAAMSHGLEHLMRTADGAQHATWMVRLGPGTRGRGEVVLSDAAGAVIGQLSFRFCLQCRTGRIQNIWINEVYQRQSLGRQAVQTLLAAVPGCQWSTTVRSRAGHAFFQAMDRETEVSFPPRGPLCPHVAGSWRRWGRRLGRLLLP